MKVGGGGGGGEGGRGWGVEVTLLPTHALADVDKINIRQHEQVYGLSLQFPYLLM